MLTPEASPRPLTEAEIERFWSDGVIIVRDFYSERWVSTVREALNDICGLRDDVAEAPKEPRFRADAYMWHTNDRLRDFSLFAPTAHAVGQVLRSSGSICSATRFSSNRPTTASGRPGITTSPSSR